MINTDGYSMNADAARDRPLPVATMGFMTLAGVLLPLAAIVFESITGMCRTIFFDPLPTPFHIAMFATIPLANMRLIAAFNRGQSVLPSPWMWLYGFSAGVAIFYSIVFLPIAPIALIGVIAFGIGLLGLSPLLALACFLLGRRAFKKWSGQALPVWRGIALAAVMFLVIESPATVTRIGVQLAHEGTAEERLRGVKLLRLLGSESELLRLCYHQTGRATDLLGTLLQIHRPGNPDLARTLFYRVTGEPYNSRPPPVRHSAREWQEVFDQDLGGEAVGQSVSGVQLAASRMDGSIDTQAALGYLEWTMEFRNTSSQQQEARAEILLPPGAVVSRATLWIAGEEREAAFGGRAQVRQAYQSVVHRNRDPLLVTTAGADLVLVQLFPIPAGGDMKIRIGITAPLTLEASKAMQFQLPAFSERNFDIGLGLRHAVWVESTDTLQGSAGLESETGPGGVSAVRGQLAEPEPGQPVHAVMAPNVAPAPLAWSMDDKNDDGKVIVQTRSEMAVLVPSRVAIVIDGSASMRTSDKELARAVAAFPQHVEMAVVFAGDDAPRLFLHDRANSLATRGYLEALKYAGGRDSTDALALAWDWASERKGSALVWIHGPQPVAFGTFDGLRQRFERRKNHLELYDVAAQAGPNLIAKKLDGIATMTRVPRRGALADNMLRLFARWQPGATHFVVKRERRTADNMPKAAETSTHLARLWAAGELAPLNWTAASALAIRYQLVTPVSGAVVLETREQYADAGLEPVAPGSVPTIPEPETWMLIIVSLIVLALRRRYRPA